MTDGAAECVCGAAPSPRLHKVRRRRVTLRRLVPSSESCDPRLGTFFFKGLFYQQDTRLRQTSPTSAAAAVTANQTVFTGYLTPDFKGGMWECPIVKNMLTTIASNCTFLQINTDYQIIMRCAEAAVPKLLGSRLRDIFK